VGFVEIGPEMRAHQGVERRVLDWETGLREGKLSFYLIFPMQSDDASRHSSLRPDKIRGRAILRQNQTERSSARSDQAAIVGICAESGGATVFTYITAL
jgi:hypothetical protein